ncbi:hypothetical protein ACEPAF_6439 [Sanghuangporus sanghuang]
MDLDIKCNNLSCRKTLIDKAVVTSSLHSDNLLSHILRGMRQRAIHFRSTLSCLRDSLVGARRCSGMHVSSLHPSNDYKTSVLSGLAPSLILEICGRALSFWQYQTHQEYGISSFQQAVLKNMNERNAQLQKQLDNVIREANGELSLLNNKLQGLERELEIERRKIREMQDAARERDKEYQKLKNHYDKIKRKALLAPNSLANDGFAMPGPASNENQMAMERPMNKGRNVFANPGGVNAVVGGMEANGIQRTPLRSGMGGIGVHQVNDWQPLIRHDGATFRAPSASDQSADEVENILSTSHQVHRQFMPRPANNTGQFHGRMMSAQSAPMMQQNTRRIKAFRPAIIR